MIDLTDIEKAIQLLKMHGLQELEWRKGEASVRLVAPAPLPFVPANSMPLPQLISSPSFVQQSGVTYQQTPAAEEKDKGEAPVGRGIELRSPFVGTFYGAPSPGADSFVSVGKRVRKGDTLCIVEAMKLMNEIEAECDGVIAKVCVENEQPIEFNQLLFVIEP